MLLRRVAGLNLVDPIEAITVLRLNADKDRQTLGRLLEDGLDGLGRQIERLHAGQHHVRAPGPGSLTRLTLRQGLGTGPARGNQGRATGQLFTDLRRYLGQRTHTGGLVFQKAGGHQGVRCHLNRVRILFLGQTLG